MSCTGCENSGIWQLSATEAEAWMFFTPLTGTPSYEQTVAVLPDGNLPDPMPTGVSATREEARVPFNSVHRYGLQPADPTGLAILSAGERQKRVANKCNPGGSGFNSNPFMQRAGYRFEKDTDPNVEAGEPKYIEVVPLSFAVTPQHGGCSGTTSCTTASKCQSVISMWLEIWNSNVVTKDFTGNLGEAIKPPSTMPAATAPQTLSVHDPLAATASVNVSYQSATTSRSEHMPTGDYPSELNQDTVFSAEVFSTVQIAQVDVTLDANCGDWSIWRTDLEKWGVSFAGYTMKNSHIDKDLAQDVRPIVFGLHCKKCVPSDQRLPVPGGLGQVPANQSQPGTQGDGKNRNNNSIGF
jgi:hypothetical protein